MSLILCGMPYVGKTTIGLKLAHFLNLSFIDLDDLIEQNYKKKLGISLNCRQIFQRDGENFFRLLEKEQLFSLTTSSKKVIALGGGALVDSENLHHILTIGKLIYLKLPLTLLWQRIKVSPLPAYLETKNPYDSFYKLAKKRLPIFEKNASLIFDLNLFTEKQLLEEIIKHG